MAKTLVDTFIEKLKSRYDYSIVDSNLDTLLLGSLNDSLRLVKQWLFDAGIIYDKTTSTSFQQVPGVESRDITNAIIVGDTSTFTGVAGDLLLVTIDGTAYDTIDVSASTDIDDVVTAINSATGGTEASNNSTSTTLQITSTTQGSTSNVTIADGTGGNSGEAARLFSIAADRTATGIADLDDIVELSERINQRVIPMLPWSDFRFRYTNPSFDSAVTPDYASRFGGLIYFGPQASSYTRIYMEYVQLIVDVSAGDTLPFEDKYDLVLLASTRLEFLMWQDPSNTQAISAASALRDKYKTELITTAARKSNVNMQSRSRNETPFLGPQSPENGTFF